MQQLFIPKKIKVGFQKRENTYTGKLAYIIYFDQKNVLRKETSWENWRDSKIDPIEFNNEPIDGFVLNKGVGGQRQSYGWNARNEYIRVWDPRDFEFEISVANLLFILRECDCNKGKGLEGKFIYAWDRKELVLLPIISQDYKKSQNFTQLQDKNVKFEELIPGALYTTKNQTSLTYLGRFNYYFPFILDRDFYTMEINVKKTPKDVVKKFVFWNNEHFIFLDNLKSIAMLENDTIIPNYANLVDKYNKSKNGSKIIKLFLENKTKNDARWYYEQEDGVFVECATMNKGIKNEYIFSYNKYYIKDGVFIKENYPASAYNPNKIDNQKNMNQYYYSYSKKQLPFSWHEETNKCLFAMTENGKKIKIED